MSDYSGGLDAARELIPPQVRRALYAAGSLAGYALAAAAVGFTAAGTDVPPWVGVALAVLGALMGPLGQLAASNTSTQVAAPDRGIGWDTGGAWVDGAAPLDPDGTL